MKKIEELWKELEPSRWDRLIVLTYKPYYWYLSYISSPLARVKRIIHWIPLLWMDADHDYCYLLRIIEKKLSHMGADFERGKSYKDLDKEIRTLRTMKVLCRRLQEDNYYFVASTGRYRGSEIRNQDLELLSKLVRTQLTKLWW